MNKTTFIIGIIVMLLIATAIVNAIIVEKRRDRISSNQVNIEELEKNILEQVKNQLNNEQATQNEPEESSTFTDQDILKEIENPSPNNTILEDLEGSNNEKTTSITLENNSFSPDSITIPLNTTIHFINNSNQDMWIIADETNEVINDNKFNQEGNGIQYYITFTKAGIFNYYNKNNPEIKGTIVVEE